MPLHARQESRQVTRSMAEIGIHGDEQIVSLLQGILNSGLDGSAEAELAGTMMDPNPGIASRQLIGDSPVLSGE